MNNNNNGKKTLMWLKNNYKFFFVIIGLIISAVIFVSDKKTQIDNNTAEILKVKNTYEESVEKIFEKLDNSEFGLSAIHQRLKALEKKN